LGGTVRAFAPLDADTQVRGLYLLDWRVRKILRDDKGSFRIDANMQRWGSLSGYYFFDD
jgi:hypothetical protein